MAGGIVALIDATVGWYISWLIGPCRPKSEMNGMRIGRIISIVTLKGAALGLTECYVRLQHRWLKPEN